MSQPRRPPVRLVAMVSLLLAAGPSSAAPPADGVCAEHISGRVVDAETGEPVDEATVRADRDDGEPGPPILATTRSNGAFMLHGLCPTAYRLEVLHIDHPHVVRRVFASTEDLELALEPGVEEVVVVESARGGIEDSHASTTIDGEALERTRGADLSEAAATVPGVSILRGSAGTSQPIVRGQYGRRLLVTVDGVRHESQKWGLDHGTEVDPFAAGSLRVVKGAAGVRFGPDAIGGVIEVLPRPLRTTPGIDGEAHLLGGTNAPRGTLALRLDGAHARVPGLAWRLEGNATMAATASAPDYLLGNTALRRYNVGGTIGYRRERVELTVSYRRHALQAGVFFGQSSGTPDDFEAALARTRPVGADAWALTLDIERPYQAVAHDQVMARALVETGDVGTVHATYSFQLDRRMEYDRVRSSVTGPQFDFTLRTHALDLRFEHHPIALGTLPRLEGALGTSGSFQENLFEGLPLLPNYRSGEVGLFAYERIWAPRWEVELGGRYDHRSQSTYLTERAFDRHIARDTLGGDACTLADEVADCPQAWNTGSVTLGLLTRPVLDVWTIKADLSSASRFPDADELYLNGTAPSFPVSGLGDPSQGVETTWSGSLTTTLDTRWIDGEISAHASYVQDYIAFGPARSADGAAIIDVVSRGAFPRFVYAPVDAALYGVDGFVAIAPDYPLHLDVQTAIVRGDDLTNGLPLPLVPPDRVRGTLTYEPPEGAGFSDSYLSVSGEYVAEQTRTDPAIDLAPPPAARGLLGAAIGTTLTVKGQRIGLSLAAHNLLNTPYRTYTSLLRYYADEPGRDVSMHLSVHFAHTPRSTR